MSFPIHPSRDSRRAEPRRSLNGSLPSGRRSFGDRSREKDRSGERAPINRPREDPIGGKSPPFRRARSPPIRPRSPLFRRRDNVSRSTDNLSRSYETGRPSRPSSDIRPASAAARPRHSRSSPLNRSAEGARSRDNPARAAPHRRSNELSQPRERQEEREDQGFSLKVRIVTNEKTEEKRVPGVSIKSRLGKRQVVKVPDPVPRRRAISSNLPPARPLRAARPGPIRPALRTAPARRALGAVPIRTPVRTAFRGAAARAAPLRPVPARDTIKRAERSSPARVSKYNQDLLKDKLRKLKSLKIKRQFLEKTKTTAYRDLRELRKNEIAQELARKRKEKKYVSSAATKRSPSLSIKRSPRFGTKRSLGAVGTKRSLGAVGTKGSPGVPASAVRRKVSSGHSSQTSQPSVRRSKVSSSPPDPPRSNIKQVHHLNNFNITKHYGQEEANRGKEVFVTKDSYYHGDQVESKRSPTAVSRQRKEPHAKKRQSAPEISKNGRSAEARGERPRRSREVPSKTKVTHSVRRHSGVGRSSHRSLQAVNRMRTPPSKSCSSKKRSPRQKNDDIKRQKMLRNSEVYHFGSDISEDEAGANLVVKEEAVSSSSSSSASSSSSDSDSSPAPSPAKHKVPPRQPRRISNSKWCSDSDNDAVSIHASPRVHHLPNFEHKVISRYENSQGTRGNSPERMFRQRICPLCHLDLKTMDDVKRHVMSQRHQIITGEFFHTRPELLRPAGRNDEVICTICNSVISRSFSQHERQGLHKEMMARWNQRKQPLPPYPYYLHKGTPKKEKK